MVIGLVNIQCSCLHDDLVAQALSIARLITFDAVRVIIPTAESRGVASAKEGVGLSGKHTHHRAGGVQAIRFHQFQIDAFFSETPPAHVGQRRPRFAIGVAGCVLVVGVGDIRFKPGKWPHIFGGLPRLGVKVALIPDEVWIFAKLPAHGVIQVSQRFCGRLFVLSPHVGVVVGGQVVLGFAGHGYIDEFIGSVGDQSAKGWIAVRNQRDHLVYGALARAGAKVVAAGVVEVDRG